MNRSELIKRISKEAGVAESDSGRFFEDLAIKSSGLLDANQVLELPDLGYIKVEGKEEKHFIFSTAGDFNSEDAIDFYLSTELYKSSPIDNVFSLSVDTLDIPISEESLEDFSHPTTSSAIEDLINEKAEVFVKNSRIISEESLLKIEESPDTEEEHLEVSNETEEEVGLAEEEHVEEDLDVRSKFEKVEPESSQTAEIDKTEEENKQETESEPDPFNIEEFEIIDTSDTISSEIDNEVFRIDHLDEFEVHEEEAEEEETEEEEVKDSEVFKPVESTEDLTADDLNTFKDEHGDTEVEEIEQKDEETEPKTEVESEEEQKEESDEHGFQIVNPILPDIIGGKFIPKKPSELFQIYKTEDEILNFDDKGFTEVNPPKKVVPGTPLLEHPGGENTIDSGKIDKFNQIKSTISSESSKKSSSGGKGKIIILIIALLIIAGGVLIYLNNIRNTQPSGNEPMVQNMTSPFVPSHPKIIKRNYDIPVNYPYNLNESGIGFEPLNLGILSNKGKAATTPIIPKAKVDTSKKRAVAKASPKSEENPVSKTVHDWERAKPIPANNFRQVDNYIYTNGKTYFIQVASWKVLDRALEHNSKLQKKGYDSSIEKLVSPSGYIYYIVKIGNFNSLKEAQQYLKSH